MNQISAPSIEALPYLKGEPQVKATTERRFVLRGSSAALSIAALFLIGTQIGVLIGVSGATTTAAFQQQAISGLKQENQSLHYQVRELTYVLGTMIDSLSDEKLVVIPERASQPLKTPPVTTPVVEVIKKANLRSGPGLSHAPLMAVATGTRLVVEERDSAGWLRVISPSGERAYVLQDLTKNIL